MICRWALIPTHNRVEELHRCIDSIKDQVDSILILDNASEPRVPYTWHDQPVPPDVSLHYDPEQPPYLSRLWNNGIRWIEHEMQERGVDEWDVAILNDDAIVPEGWFHAVGVTMREQGAGAGCSCDRRSPGTMFHFDKDDKPSQDTRLTGWAFMIRGESKLRFDEQFQWWCGDDDLSMQVRKYYGGLIKVGGFAVQNTGANSSTVGNLLAQSAVDMQRFVDKWGVRPW